MFLPMICSWGRKKGKVARLRAWISFPSRSDLVQHLVLIPSSLIFTQCAHNFVKIWWCEWACWMSCAQCDLLLVAWEVDCVFSWCSTQCAHGLVKTWWCQWLVCWLSRAQCHLLSLVWELEWFFLCFTQCAHDFVKIWWCQWMCWMSRAQCDLLLVVWVLAMAWDSVFLRARSSGVSFG